MELKNCKFESISKVNFDTIIDVRSPKEFTEDHIPNSINLPVLSDFEREVVGKIYIQNSQFEAKKIGAKYISENNISILGSPLPFEEHEVDWTKDEINLKFEIAHTPQFKINYKPKKLPTYYTVEADNEMISTQVESIRDQYGKLITLEFPDKESTILGKVKYSESENEKSLSLDSQKFKKGFFSKHLSKSTVGSSI